MVAVAAAPAAGTVVARVDMFSARGVASNYPSARLNKSCHARYHHLRTDTIIVRLIRRRRSNCTFLQVRASASAESDTRSSSTKVDATTAAEAVNMGLSLFSKGRVSEAMTHFNAALEMNPTPEEAQAALYNKACCHSYREEGEQAAQALKIALREYNLKFSTILNDPDMAPFRSMPEFKQLQNEAREGGQEVGKSFRRDLKLISEVRAPFRVVRKFLYIAFTIAAGIGVFFTVPRFFLAFQGGEGAPDKLETAQNLAINIGEIKNLEAKPYTWFLVKM